MSKTILIPLLFVIVAATGAANGETFSAIRGRLHYVLREPVPETLPLSGVEVTLSGPALSRPRTATTNARGEFFFSAVPPGIDYRLTLASEFAGATGQIGGIAASETLFADVTFDLLAVFHCNSLCWHVQRRSPTIRYHFPEPPGPVCGICI